MKRHVKKPRQQVRSFPPGQRESVQERGFEFIGWGVRLFMCVCLETTGENLPSRGLREKREILKTY